MIKRILIIVFLLFIAAPSFAATQIFSDGFEDGTLSPWVSGNGSDSVQAVDVVGTWDGGTD